MDVLNFNIGLLGHVDSGKTSLAKALSTISSTAAFDKNPQSQERGITIDLGFSSFVVDMPQHIETNYKRLQFTLVDCPGHASLIKTIIGGAHIIDLMLLVVDITKGIQTQTAECLIIGEILCNQMIIVLNKIDLIDEKNRTSVVEKMTKRLKNTLKDTVFKDSPVVNVSAKSEESWGVESLIEELNHRSYLPERDPTKPFLFAVDHCFGIKGKGTVLTGTVLQGKVKVNDEIELPAIKLLKKVKSIQMFKTPVEKAQQGDRIGVCVTQFDPKLLERGIACEVNYVSVMHAVVVDFNKIKYFKSVISSKSKFHVTLGYETVIARITLFGSDQYLGESFNLDKQYMYIPEYEEETFLKSKYQIFVLLEFEKPTLVVPNTLTIGSKLDMDIHANVCRLGFYGNVVYGMASKNYLTEDLPKLKIFKEKQKKGVVERMVNETEVIGKNMFKKETNMSKFTNLKVALSTGEVGFLESAFGQSGKFKLRIPDGLKKDTQALLVSKKKGSEVQGQSNVEIILEHRKFLFDPKKQLIQV